LAQSGKDTAQSPDQTAWLGSSNFVDRSSVKLDTHHIDTVADSQAFKLHSIRSFHTYGHCYESAGIHFSTAISLFLN
jgi:hypothetical protein